MSLPSPLRRALGERLSGRGAASAPGSPPPSSTDHPGAAPGPFRPLGGGCIHHAGRLDTGAGPLFLKWNRGEAATGFAAEARALEALRDAADPGLLDVPRVVDAQDADGADSFGWLVLEFLPPGPPAPDHDARLGRGLALLHGHPGPSFGWPETNRIGPLPQVNPSRDRWADFWVDARLLPQVRAARDEGLLDPPDVDRLERVAAAVPAALAPVADDPPALIHGDLWSGNVHPGPRGRPVLVDPAAYHGHGEVDLAMARLFGGFAEETFRAYDEVRPVPDGFDEVRCPLYQLFFLLVHVRLFGASYLGRTRTAARAVLSGTGTA